MQLPDNYEKRIPHAGRFVTSFRRLLFQSGSPRSGLSSPDTDHRFLRNHPSFSLFNGRSLPIRRNKSARCEKSLAVSCLTAFYRSLERVLEKYPLCLYPTDEVLQICGIDSDNGRWICGIHEPCFDSSRTRTIERPCSDLPRNGNTPLPHWRLQKR